MRGRARRVALLASVAALPVILARPAFSAPQVWDWSGFYVGVTGGAGRSKSSQSTTLPCTEAAGGPGNYICSDVSLGDAPVISAALTGSSSSKAGFIGGGEAGYNWQAGPAVFGLEIDLQNFRGVSTSATVLGTGAAQIPLDAPIYLTSSAEAQWLFTARGRLGYAFDRLLMYGTGGLAVTRLTTDFTYNEPGSPAQGSGTQSNTKIGSVIGAGVEYKLTGNWSVKAEYLHVKFGAITATGVITAAGGYANAISTSADLTANIARAGVNYKF